MLNIKGSISFLVILILYFSGPLVTTMLWFTVHSIFYNSVKYQFVQTRHFIGVVRPGSSQSLSRIQASAVITPFIWRGGCADTNIVFSFRTHGHEQSEEF